ncbi:uncharacterized protein LOC114530701 [Dendronephthya gigantea]|uniref:uncharacterized protein LOC114530701 n=1 Tax=Dendronephthya gigantea TaxID=151771 RepID=UPI00106CEBF9|nr:uncharacterized protein LOC114530701 [Dendronephthya gigantea]
MLISENIFSANLCPKKAVICLESDVSSVRLEKNIFDFNLGRCLHMAGNKANGVVSLQVVYKTESTFKRRGHVNFTQNVLSHNLPSSSSGRIPGKADSCSVSVSGVLFFKKTDIHFNSFDNPEYTKEFCVLVPATSHRDIIDISNNWWRTENSFEVRDRISDFDDNYDYAIAESWPFLNANKSLALGLRQYYKQRGRILSGRITESTSLKASKSPYRITSDLTILKNTTLVVEAGVTLKLLPGVSILVIGALQVKGTPLQPVHFTIDNPTGRNNRSRMIVRLADGSFPWQGMAQLFNGSVWLPLVTPGNLSASNLTNVICKQLGYGPPTTGKQIGISPFQNVSDFFQLHCLGNETTLDECNNVEKNKSSNMSLVHLECHGTVWGNVRFVSSSEKNLTQPRSSLNFVKFTHCGNRHGMHVPAIETVINIPIMNAITVQNCTAGGLTIAFPNRNVHINQSLFLNTGGTAITVLQTRRKVLVENSMFRENIRGISFEEPRMEKEPQVNYGRVFLCSDVKLIHIQTTKLFYFKLSLLENIPVVQHCEKALTAPDGKGFKLVVLYQSGSRYIQIFDSHSSNDKSIYQGSVASIVQKDFFIPRGEILLRWNGDSNSKITVLIEAIKISDMPCTFELDFCGWQSFTNVSVVGRKMSQTWARNSYTYYLSDHSYFSDHGKLLISRGSYLNSKSLNAGIISPIIESQQFCFFRFFYYLRSESFRSLSGIYIYTITGSYTNFQRRLIWSTRKYRIYQWEKVLLRLPRYADEYRIALVGETTSGYVAIDDLELMLCNVGDHRLSNNIFVGNKQNSIQYTSLAAEKAESRPKFVIERSQVVNTLSSTNSVSKSPIFLEIQDNYFTIANNFIANNIHGGIEAKLGGNFAGTRQKSTDCSIYGNTFVGNTNGAILLVGRGSGIQRIRIKIMKNTFENNLGPFSTFKVNNIQVNIVSNFFFNNSGKHTLEYHFESDGFKDQTCEMNTFYFNRGVGPSHGVTILTNGPVDFRRNNFKNPVNLYELSSRKMSVTDPIKAINNWWGAGKADYVRSRIYGKKKNDEFALVIYEPFKKLPPRDILSIGCPPSWQKIGSTCVVVRRGVQTFKEAVEYCQYHGGRVASWSSAEEKKFIAMALVESRPEEEQHVAIWVMTKQYLENGQISKQKCAVRTYEYKYRAVPCKSLYPYICTQAAVTHCPNGCFHNGDCVGTTCFCYRGWTGRDCSQFHCNEANNCSGNGLCIGPNACKCSVGFLGRGCTYSVCGKFRKCIDCYRDSSCGWCDSSQQCIAGTSIGPHSTKCPDWFYHNCHTVGNVSTCSKNIMRVDCAMRQCNRSEKTTTLESCQKCHDYEKCFKKVEEGVCKSWNDTRCPDGRVHADYSDPKRVENVVYKKNVKIVDPKITKIYNCPIQVAGEEDSSLVLVAPAKLGLKVGDVLLSGQAGGLMHKVSDTTEKGNFTFILGRPAAIKEAISYADFTQEGKAAQFIDETTLDIEPNSEYVNGVIDGSIKLKETKIHVLSKETSFFKCLAGYIYEIGENVLTTYYIVMEKSKVEDVSQGDVFVSVKNSGFIERVVQKTINQNISFLETKIERCTQEFDLTNRFIKARPSSKEDVYCFGGDNNNGIVISELSDGSENKEIEVGDLIMGREGYRLENQW